MAVINLASEQRYYETMSGNDAFTVIIRGVAYLDFELDKLLALCMKEPGELKAMNLDFAKRCALAIALGLDREIKPALTAVGNLRNKLAHQPERHLTPEDAENLHSALSPRERQKIPAFLDKMARSPKVKFHELSAMDKYVIMLVLLRSIVVAAQRNIENAHNGR
ncbi:MAG: hypothetical protein EOR30_21305 [Mesorhizobium sp.]|uniref:hypothetical protein n=1 Tax=unclassified Mesorhizobium TaxID=325217 RepID=UPI000FCA2E1E|nr:MULTISPECIES: hypothetical protein [unclassified Mesorhizobium]RUV75374.1 hypothetical protein EOA78_06670 [Mesorhizobium sp. M5C.F.Cr.IN.023.01.1.1]RWF87471.1 MAG: hypothetical protein EOQ36_12220 [Mesorhizobium sp.]RWF91004.1 MAG: hypothetical protein EOQ45_27715 [Mesorhizobium sp.]RWI40117.1 MAG: hypothetical protein EOR14_15940 [Mesorhizobium sp.]RWI45917.1 MAG: hypothetical protein EOR15_20645 [Mesorhizobium sp.]